VHALLRAEAADEQPADGEQEERQRELSDHERVAEARARGGTAVAAVLQPRQHVGAGGVQRRREAEDDPRPDGDEHREGQHAQVGRRVEPDGQRERRDEVRRPERREHGRDGAAEREEHALGEELPDDAPPARAEREADRDLAAPPDRAGEEQVRDVHRRDEQHDPRDREHSGGEAEDVAPVRPGADHRAPVRHRDHPVLVLLRVLLGQRAHDGVQRRLRLLARRPRREARHDVEPPRAARLEEVVLRHDGPLHGHRDEEVAGALEVRAREALRRDADHGERAPVDGHRAPDDARVGAEALAPQPVAEHDDRARHGRGVLVGDEEAPERGAHAEHREVVPRDELAPDGEAGRAAALHHRRRGAVGDDALQPACPRAEVEVVRVGARPVAPVADAVLGPLARVHAHELPGPLDGERPQEERVDEAEDDGVDADAQGERADGGQREAGRLHELAQRITNVLQHSSLSSYALRRGASRRRSSRPSG
jgi:hypothetical protein